MAGKTVGKMVGKIDAKWWYPDERILESDETNLGVR